MNIYNNFKRFIWYITNGRKTYLVNYLGIIALLLGYINDKSMLMLLIMGVIYCLNEMAKRSTKSMDARRNEVLKRI